VPSDDAKITRRSSLVIGEWEMRPSTVAMKSSPVLIFEWRPRIAAPCIDYWRENLRRSDALERSGETLSYLHIVLTSSNYMALILVHRATSV
jgi:hypothetical protein